MEADEAGKLRAFREKFGRGWDASRRGSERGDEVEGEGQEFGQDGGETGGQVLREGEMDGGGEDNLMDLISGYGREAEGKGEAAGKREGKEKSGKGKGGQR